MDPAEYRAVRTDRRRAMMAAKRQRRMEVGPHCTFYFENYDTMWHQVHEMLYIENGGEDQIADELAAYNPLIPNGRELVATVMFEIEDDGHRARVLARLGGVEETFAIEIDGQVIRGVAETDVDRTTADGKASSVQFVHFPFDAAQIDAFRTPEARVVLSVGHENYRHMAVMPEAVRAALAEDFD